MASFEIETPLNNKNEIIISIQNRSQNSSEIIFSFQKRSQTASVPEIDDKNHLKSSSPFKVESATPDLKKTDENPQEIEGRSHLKSSSPLKTAVSTADLKKTDENPREIEDKSDQKSSSPFKVESATPGLKKADENPPEIEGKSHLKSSSPLKTGVSTADLKKTDEYPLVIEMPLGNKNEIVISTQNGSQNSSEVIVSILNRSRSTANVRGITSLISSFPFKSGVATPDVTKTGPDPQGIEHENHSEMITSGATTTVVKKNLPEVINDEQVRFMLHILPLFVATLCSFIVSYRGSKGHISVSILGYVSLNLLLVDYFMSIMKLTMPERKKLWMIMKLSIWMIFIFLCSELSLESIEGLNLVVMALTSVLVLAWIISAIVNTWKIWLSGRDEIGK